MQQKKLVPSAGKTLSPITGQPYPKEAYDFTDEISADAIAKLRKQIGVDYAADEWETIDGLGQVVDA